MSAVVEAREPSARYLVQPPSQLLRDFGVLATSMDGVSKLRRLILSLAVRGRLLPGRLASMSVESRDPDLPCALPEGWRWTRLSDLGDFRGGKTPNTQRAEYWSGSIPWITPKDMKQLHLSDSQDHVTAKAIEDGLALVPRGSLLVVVRSGILRRTVPTAINLVETTINQDLKALVLADPRLAPYVQLLVRGFEQFILEKHTKVGTTVESMQFEAFASQQFPLPPLDEQARIVARVDELMRLCDALETNGRLEAEQHAGLLSTLLGTLTDSTTPEELATNWQRVAEHFDQLLDRPEAVDELEQLFMQLAVRGLLTARDESDESAEQLLCRLRQDRGHWLSSNASINTECAAMQRKLEALPPPDHPFRIPKGWTFVRLLDCCRLLVDCHNKTAPYVTSGVPIIRTSNVRGGSFRLDSVNYVSEETYNFWSRRCPPKEGDIIFTREAPMGEAAIIPPGVRYCLGQRTMLIRPMHEYVTKEYLLLALTEPHLLERAAPAAVGSTVKHLRVGDVERLSIPLPPLAEQQRIVTRVSAIRALCADLRQRLVDAQATQSRLADALVEQALA